MTTDLHDRLSRLAGEAVSPSADTISADLDRARRALRRRRLGRFGGAAGAIAAATVAGILMVPGAQPTPARVPVQLVAYTGTQPAGFTIDEVPQGWEVQGVGRYGLVLGPIGATDRNPRSFVGKIAVMLQHTMPDDVGKQPVTVAGQPATLATMKGDTVPTTLFIRQPSGDYLVIQVWDSLGWGEHEIVRFATGIHVQPGALLSVG